MLHLLLEFAEHGGVEAKTVAMHHREMNQEPVLFYSREARMLKRAEGRRGESRHAEDEVAQLLCNGAAA